MKKAISFITFGLISLATAIFFSITLDFQFYKNLQFVGFDAYLSYAYSSLFVITVLITELDLFYSISYLSKAISEQTFIKTVLNAVLIVVALLVLGFTTPLYFGEYTEFTYLIFKGSILVYPVLRGLYLIVSAVCGIIKKIKK